MKKLFFIVRTVKQTQCIETSEQDIKEVLQMAEDCGDWQTQDDTASAARIHTWEAFQHENL